jgi:hypothetical protein
VTHLEYRVVVTCAMQSKRRLNARIGAVVGASAAVASYAGAAWWTWAPLSGLGDPAWSPATTQLNHLGAVGVQCEMVAFAGYTSGRWPSRVSPVLLVA